MTLQPLSSDTSSTLSPIAAIYHRLDDLPGDYSQPVRRYLQHQLGTVERPASFVGREADLTRLQLWLNDPLTPPYALLTGPAGSGKSTLAAQWAAELEAQGMAKTPYHLIYFPISIRFGSASEVVALRALCVRLARAHGDWPTAQFGAGGYYNLLSQYLQRPLPDGQPLLVVLDGLDEALGWEVWPALIQSQRTPHLRVLVTANEPDGQPGWEPWLNAVARGLATRLRLVPAAGMDHARWLETWLKQQPPLLRQAGLEDAQVAAFLNVCAVANGPLTAADVRAVTPDMFVSDQAVQRVAQAVSPLLAPTSDRPEYVYRHPATAEYFVRQLKLKGEYAAWQGRFAQYCQATLSDLQTGTLPPSQASAYAVRYCSAHLRLIQAAPEAYFPMLSESWWRAWGHLEGTADGFLNDARRVWIQAAAAGRTSLLIQIRALLAFSSLASLKSEASREFICDHLRQGRLHPRLALQWARGKSLSYGDRVTALVDLMPELPVTERPAVLAEALAMARMVPDAHYRAKALNAVAAHSAEVDRPAVLTNLLAAARRAKDAGGATALAAASAYMPAADRSALLSEALTLARGEPEDRARVNAVAAVAAQLPEAERPAVRTEAFQLALEAADVNGDGDPVIYREGIVDTGAALVSEASGPAARAEALASVLNGIRALDDVCDQARVLKEIAARLPYIDGAPLLAEADSVMRAPGQPLGTTGRPLDFAQATPRSDAGPLAEELARARSLSDDADRAETLSTLVRRLPAEEQPAILAEALTAARQIKWETMRVATLGWMAKHLPAADQADVLAEALAAARRIPYAEDRAESLLKLAELLPIGQRPAILAEALLATRSSRHKLNFMKHLFHIAARLPVEQKPMLWDEILTAIQGNASDQGKAGEIENLAAQLPPGAAEWRAKAVEAAQAIRGGLWRTKALCALAHQQPAAERQALLTEALRAARSEEFGMWRCEALLQVAQRLPIAQRNGALAEAIAASQQTDPRIRRDAIDKTVEQLPPDADLWSAALSATWAVWDLETQSTVLLQLADYLSAPERLVLVTQALAAARAIWDCERRAQAVLAVARRAPPEFRPTAVAAAVKAAWNCEHDFQQVEALSAVLEVVPPEDQPQVAAEALVAAIYARESSVVLEAVSRWLAPELLKPMFERAVAIIWKARGPATACYDLVRLAPMMPVEDRPAVYRAAVAGVMSARNANSEISSQLQHLAEHLPLEAADLMAWVMAAAQDLKPADRECVLRAAAAPRPAPMPLMLPSPQQGQGSRLTTQPRPAPEPWPALTAEAALQEFQFLTDRLQAARAAPRPQVFQLLVELFPQITRLGGEAAGRETAQAILDAIRIWP